MKSVACGSWSNPEGTDNWHERCTGEVLLPAPDDKCDCGCHKLAGTMDRKCKVCKKTTEHRVIPDESLGSHGGVEMWCNECGRYVGWFPA